MPQLSSNRLDLIQVLRAVAAILVLFTHSIDRLRITFPMLGKDEWPDNNSGIYSIGNSGVDIFFVISGFLMLYVNYDYFQRPGAPRRFFLKRLVRIIPLYWSLTTLAVIMIVVSPSVFTYRNHVIPEWIIGSYLFVPVAMNSGIVSPVIGPGWTLNFEMYFYLLFSICLIWSRVRALLCLCIFFCLSVIIGAILHPLSPLPALMTSGQLLEFMAGMLIALASKEALPFSRWGSLASIIIGWMFLLLSTVYFTPRVGDGLGRFLFWGIPAAMIVAGAKDLSLGRGPLSKPLILLGDGSYSIYLFHTFALPASAIILRRSGMQSLVSFDMMVIFLIVIGIVSGMLCWYFVERPMTSRFTKLVHTQELPVAVMRAEAAETVTG